MAPPAMLHSFPSSMHSPLSRTRRRGVLVVLQADACFLVRQHHACVQSVVDDELGQRLRLAAEDEVVQLDDRERRDDLAVVRRMRIAISPSMARFANDEQVETRAGAADLAFEQDAVDGAAEAEAAVRSPGSCNRPCSPRPHPPLRPADGRPRSAPGRLRQASGVLAPRQSRSPATGRDSRLI